MSVSEKAEPASSREDEPEGHQSVSLSAPSLLSLAITDLVKGATHWRLWTVMAWHGLRQRYKRSWLGLGWIALSFALFSGVKIFVFGALSDKPIAYFAGFLVIGYLIFRLIVNFVTGGAAVFVSATSWIKSEPLPLSVHIYKLMTNNLIVFAYSAVPALLFCVYFGVLNWSGLFVLPIVLIVYAINGLWISALMGVICVRHRDILHFVGTVMQIFYFVTPILWVPPETGPRALIANINPLTHYIAIFRTPILDGTIPWESWKWVAICTIVGAVVSFIVFMRSRRQIVFWL